MSKHIYLPDVVSDRASVSFRFSIRVFLSISGRACSGFSARPGMRPDPAQPLAPHLPHAPHVPLSISFLFPAQQLPSPSLIPLALGVIRWTVATIIEPRGELPLPPPLSLPSLPSPCARPSRGPPWWRPFPAAPRPSLAAPPHAPSPRPCVPLSSATPVWPQARSRARSSSA
jgi:hypothetical protein